MEALNLPALAEEQRKLARKILLSDSFDEIKTIAGCDVSYTGDKQIAAIVVCDAETMKIRESKHTIGRAPFSHIPGFEGLRDCPILVETYHKLELDPDLLIIDGSGILHPRMLGTASQLGILIDKPAIGIAKELEWGAMEGETIYLDKMEVGKSIDTKDKAKPIYVSPGHKVSLQSAVEIAKKSITEHKLPEPLHQAHKLAAKIRNKLREEGKK